jgi:hypothetical protein
VVKLELALSAKEVGPRDFGQPGWAQRFNLPERESGRPLECRDRRFRRPPERGDVSFGAHGAQVGASEDFAPTSILQQAPFERDR